MPSDLGTDVRTLRRELSEMRLANRLRQEKLRALRLESWERLGTRNVVETISLDWITPYAELLDLTARSGDPIFTGPATYWQRRQGRNWPIYQTEQELAILRAPARLLVATNSYAQGLIEVSIRSRLDEPGERRRRTRSTPSSSACAPTSSGSRPRTPT